MSENASALVWPQLLRLPSEAVKIVYLDLNHWIYLAQAASGSPQNKSAMVALDACRAARRAGAALAVAVLSGVADHTILAPHADVVIDAVTAIDVVGG